MYVTYCKANIKMIFYSINIFKMALKSSDTDKMVMLNFKIRMLLPYTLHNVLSMVIKLNSL